MRRYLVPVIAALAMSTSLIFVQASTFAANAVAPIKVRVVTPDGKKKLLVQKKLEVLAVCSQSCAAKATITLKTPLGPDKDTLGGTLEANAPVTLSLTLNKPGLKYLRDNFRASSLKVRFTARDLTTNLRDTRTRTFRFRK